MKTCNQEIRIKENELEIGSIDIDIKSKLKWRDDYNIWSE